MEVITKKQVTLVLDEFEAEWLKAVVQNPLHDIRIEDEDKVDRQMRRRFWMALNKELSEPF